MKLIKEEEDEAMSWCRVCGRYHLFGACPRPELQDPPYPGLGEKAIASAKPSHRRPDRRSASTANRLGPEISLDGQPSVRLQTRGQP